MVAKAILVFCVQAVLAQTALCQCTSRVAIEASRSAGPCGHGIPSIAPAIAYGGLAAPFAYDTAPACGLAAPLAYDGYLAPFGVEGYAAPFAFDGLAGRGAIDFTPTSGGGLTVTSASAIPPTGISVISENLYEGILAVAGEVPFVGTTGMEGMLPTAGTGAVNHACGNGRNAMISEGATFAPAYVDAIIESAAFAPAYGAAVIAPAGIAPAAYTGCGRGFVY